MMIKYYFYLAIAFITVFVAAIFTIYRGHMVGAAAQIESNSTSTICINGKCNTTTTICIIINYAILLDQILLMQAIIIQPTIIIIIM